jgi:hypothetical protein
MKRYIRDRRRGIDKSIDWRQKREITDIVKYPLQIADGRREMNMHVGVFGGRPVILPLSFVPSSTTDPLHTSSLGALNGVFERKENHNNYSYDE